MDEKKVTETPVKSAPFVVASEDVGKETPVVETPLTVVSVTAYETPAPADDLEIDEAAKADADEEPSPDEKLEPSTHLVRIWEDPFSFVKWTRAGTADFLSMHVTAEDEHEAVEQVNTLFQLPGSTFLCKELIATVSLEGNLEEPDLGPKVELPEVPGRFSWGH